MSRQLDAKLSRKFDTFLNDIEPNSPCGRNSSGDSELSIEKVQHDKCAFCDGIIPSNQKKFHITHRTDNTKGSTFSDCYSCVSCMIHLKEWIAKNSERDLYGIVSQQVNDVLSM